MKLTHGIPVLLCAGLFISQVFGQQEAAKFGPVNPENLPAEQIVKSIPQEQAAPAEGMVTTGYEKTEVESAKKGQIKSFESSVSKNGNQPAKVIPGFGVSNTQGREKSKAGIKQKVSHQKKPLEKGGTAPQPEQQVK